MHDTLRTRLTGRAARFLALLHEYGHLESKAMEALFVRINEDFGTHEEALVDLPDLKRLCASVLFEEHPDGEDGDDVIAEDWALLFY